MLKHLLTIEGLLLALTTTLTYATPTQESTLEATDGVVVSHLFPACDGMGRRKPLTVPVDRCLSTPVLALQIKTAAICANGTQAKWARFPEKGCGHGSLDPDFGLVDLRDDQIGECLDFMKIGSMAFWCDGVKRTDPDDEKDGDKTDGDKDKMKKGSVSESSCMVGKAPFWSHHLPDKCVDLKSDSIQISTMATCANGTESTFAWYKGVGCHGEPTFNDDEASKTCVDADGMGSFAFYCTGEGIERADKGKGSNGNGGGFLQFFLVLTLIVMGSILILVLSILTWVRKYGGSVGKLIEFARSFIRPKDGGIAI